MARIPRAEPGSLFVGSITLAAMLLKQHNGHLLAAADHSHLRTMASETVDPINQQLPALFTGQYLLSVTCTMHMRATNQECYGPEFNQGLLQLQAWVSTKWSLINSFFSLLILIFHHCSVSNIHFYHTILQDSIEQFHRVVSTTLWFNPVYLLCTRRAHCLFGHSIVYSGRCWWTLYVMIIAIYAKKGCGINNQQIKKLQYILLYMFHC